MIYVLRNMEDIDWCLAAEIIERAPLGRRDPSKLRQAFQNSYAVSFAWDENKLVGLGRAISDGFYQAAIYDVVVAPELQGKRVGRALMEDLHDQLDGVENIILFAVPGKEPFYNWFGYRMLKTAMAILCPSLSKSSAGYLVD